MKDRLVTIIKDFKIPICKEIYGTVPKADSLADHLLAAGVLIPPFKEGDTVYCPIKDGDESFVTSWVVTGLLLEDGKWYAQDDNGDAWLIGGRYCYLTREEAKKALEVKG